MKAIGGALAVIAVLVFFLAIMFAGQTCTGHVGSVDWSITIPAIHLPAPGASPSPTAPNGVGYMCAPGTVYSPDPSNPDGFVCVSPTP